MINQEFVDKFRHYHKYGTWWDDLNPLTKFVVCFMVALTPIYALTWWYGLGVCVIVSIVAMTSKFRKSFFSLAVKVFLIITILLVVLRQIGHRATSITPLINIFGWQWYVETLFNSLNRASFIVGFSVTMILFFTTTPMRDITYQLEQMGVSHEASYVMLSSMQNIIDLKATAVTIFDSQKARGIETTGNAIKRAKAFFPTLAPLMIGAMQGTEEKTIALDARAFSVKRNHSFLRKLRPVQGYEWAMMAVAVIFNIAMIFVSFKILKQLPITRFF